MRTVSLSATPSRCPQCLVTVFPLPFEVESSVMADAYPHQRPNLRATSIFLSFSCSFSSWIFKNFRTEKHIPDPSNGALPSCNSYPRVSRHQIPDPFLRTTIITVSVKIVKYRVQCHKHVSGRSSRALSRLRALSCHFNKFGGRSPDDGYFGDTVILRIRLMFRSSFRVSSRKSTEFFQCRHQSNPEHALSPERRLARPATLYSRAASDLCVVLDSYFHDLIFVSPLIFGFVASGRHYSV